MPPFSSFSSVHSVQFTNSPGPDPMISVLSTIAIDLRTRSTPSKLRIVLKSFFLFSSQMLAQFPIEPNQFSCKSYRLANFYLIYAVGLGICCTEGREDFIEQGTCQGGLK